MKRACLKALTLLMAEIRLFEKYCPNVISASANVWFGSIRVMFVIPELSGAVKFRLVSVKFSSIRFSSACHFSAGMVMFR